MGRERDEGGDCQPTKAWELIDEEEVLHFELEGSSMDAQILIASAVAGGKRPG